MCVIRLYIWQFHVRSLALLVSLCERSNGREKNRGGRRVVISPKAIYTQQLCWRDFSSMCENIFALSFEKSLWVSCGVYAFFWTLITLWPSLGDNDCDTERQSYLETKINLQVKLQKFPSITHIQVNEKHTSQSLTLSQGVKKHQQQYKDAFEISFGKKNLFSSSRRKLFS